MSLAPYLLAIAPTLTKVFLKIYLGPETAEVAGSAVTVALKHFGGRRDKALSAEKAAGNLARAVLVEIGPWFMRELPAGDEPGFYAQELVDTLERGFSERAAVDAALDPAALSQLLVARKETEWALSGDNTKSLMSSLVMAVCQPLTRLVPELPRYKYERDQVVLEGLQAISTDVERILDGQITVSESIEIIRAVPEQVRQGYEDQYKKGLAGNLDYVEILGLDLKREDRVASLSTAYLSLTVDDGSKDERRVLRFEDVLLLLPFRRNRLIVEGAAGSGKSTLLRWAAIHLADPHRLPAPSEQGGAFKGANIQRFLERVLSKTDWNLFMVENASDLSAMPNVALEVTKTDLQRARINVKAWSDLQTVFIPSIGFEPRPKKLVPFLVRLRDFHGGRFPAIDELPRTVVDVGAPPEGWVRSVLTDNRGVILVDGVDEVSEERGARAAAMAALRRMVTTFPGNTYIVAGRPGAFTESPFPADDCLRVTVNEMDDDQRLEFVERWHAAKAERQSAPEATARIRANARKLGLELEQNAALRRMASNPLLAASICALHDISPSTVPRNEYELCERLAKMLVSERDHSEDEAGHRVNVADLGRAYALEYADKRTVISRIAYQMMLNGESTLSWTEAQNVVADILPSLSKAEGVTPTALLAALAIRSGVLRPAIAKAATESDGQTSKDAVAEASKEGLEFIHNRFKEWFAAISYRDRGQPTELANRLPDDPYDQIALFAVGADGAAAFSSDLMRAFHARFSGEVSAMRRRAMKLAAVRLSEAARVMEPEWRKWATSMHGELFPPSSRGEARALSPLGDTAVPYLKYKPGWTARQASLAAYCLKSIGTAAALARLDEYLADDRWTVTLDAVGETNMLRSSGFRKRALQGKQLSGVIGARLKTLTGFPDLARLTKLDLSHTVFEDLPSILDAAKLVDLDISSTNVTSLANIGRLESLRRLSIGSSVVADFRPISELRLIHLSMANTRIERADDLGNQQELVTLNMSATKIREVRHIANFASLQNLMLIATHIESYLELAQLVKLRRLLIDGAITTVDMGELSRVGGLLTLSASSAQISNFGEIGKLRHLKELRIANTNVANIDAVLGLKSLQTLNIDRCKVESLPPMEGMGALRRIDMDDTEITDISPLASAPGLRVVLAARSKVKDFNVLLESKSIKFLFVSHGVDIEEEAFAARGIRVTRPRY